jgi:hypothetical protein
MCNRVLKNKLELCGSIVNDKADNWVSVLMSLDYLLYMLHTRCLTRILREMCFILKLFLGFYSCCILSF